MRIALFHDYLVQYGGAERVLEAVAEIWPTAPIYTLLYDRESVHRRFDGKIIRTSFLQKIPFSRSHHRVFPPLMMLAAEQFDLSYYDVVISDSSSFAKNIITRPQTLHLSYCHTPMRYGWDDCQYYTSEFNFPKLVKKAVPLLMNYIRVWDYYGSNGVDQFIANSKFVAGRIKKYYGRESMVVNPPVDVEKFFLSPPEKIENYYLIVGRMMRYKRMDLAIQAFNRMGKKLKIVGRGSEMEYLKKMAGPTIEFCGRVSDEELARIYSRAKAFIFPQEEDFGIVAIEALASGRPVVAFRAGDIVEHIQDGKTGIFFDEQTEKGLIEAVEKFEKIKFDGEYIRQTALGFDKKIFQARIKEIVEEKYFQHRRAKNAKGTLAIAD